MNDVKTMIFVSISLLCCSCVVKEETHVTSTFDLSSSIMEDSAPGIRFNVQKDTCRDEKAVAKEKVAAQWYNNLIRWSEASAMSVRYEE